MKTSKILLLLGIFLILGTSTQAQSFLTPFESFSTKKTTYLTMKDGKEIEGNFRNMKRKKGLIEQIWIKVDGKVQKIPAEDIQYMYVPANNLEKFAISMESAYDATTWKSDDINREHLKDGYGFYEFATVDHKGKERQLLLQLLNPAFANGIRVYHDPFAGETMSAGIGGIKVAGGDEKSYYVKKGKTNAFRLKKKEYDAKFDGLFGDCEAVVNMVENNDPRWSDFAKHAYEYANCQE